MSSFLSFKAQRILSLSRLAKVLLSKVYLYPSIDSSHHTRELHEELILQILLKRSLLRFKSVCKSWLSLISDPEFTKSHYDLAASSTYRCLTKEVNDSEIQSIDVDDSSLVNLKLPQKYHSMFGPDPRNNVEFLGSCRGFVLVAYSQSDVFVWNPSTGVQSRRIPINPQVMIFTHQHSFGYDRSTDDYLLVVRDVIPQHKLNVADFPTTIHIFSMKTNSWFVQEGTYAQYVDNGCAHLKGAFLNDAMHWLVISYETKLYVIIAFDLVQRSLSEIPLPQVLAMELKFDHYRYHVRVMGECLSLCYVASMAEIWMMKDYKVQSSWTRLYVFPTDNIPRNVYPICFTKHGELFCSYGSRRLVIVDDKRWGLLERAKPHVIWRLLDQSTKWLKRHVMFGEGREGIIHCGLYKESLLSLPNE